MTSWWARRWWPRGTTSAALPWWEWCWRTLRSTCRTFAPRRRTFQIISQVAGRAGRARRVRPRHRADPRARTLLLRPRPGRTTIRSFFAAETGLPPRARLSAVPATWCICGLDGTRRGQAWRARARALARDLRREDNPHAPLEILGPAPAPIAKLRNRYRWQILLKGRSRPALGALARRALALAPNGRKVRVHVDVDPYNML